jgi:uncharacterized membrane protein
MRVRGTFARALPVGAAAAVLARGPSLLPRGPEDQAVISAGAAAMGGLAGAFAGGVAALAARRSRGTRVAASSALSAAGLAGWTLAGRVGRRGRAASAAESASSVTAFAAGIGEAGEVLLERMPRGATAYLAFEAGALGVRAGLALRALTRRLAEPTDLVKASIPYEYLPSVSGGKGSAAPVATLDREGRKFLGLATPASAIAEVTAEPARDPVRVYVGLASAPTPGERAALALRELERLGAYSRARLVIACPTGSGFVNPVLVEAEEHMSRGDVATVALQYNNQRSHRSLGNVPLARDTYRLLLEGLAGRIRALDRSDRPEVVVYGESLGALVGAELVAQGGLGLLEELEITRAALVGLPYAGARKLIDLRRKEGVVPESVGVFATAEEITALAEAERHRLRYIVLTHPEDPVANYTGTQLLWRRPFWLPRRGRHPRIPRGMRWTPGITFLHVLLDVKNGTSFAPEFAAYGHDYRAELPRVVRIAFGHRDVTDTQLRAIEERTARSAREQDARQRSSGR